MLVLFGFTDQQKNTYGLGKTITKKRKGSSDAIFRTTANATKRKFKVLSEYLDHFLLSPENHQVVADQMLGKSPTKLLHVKIAAFGEEVNANKIWSLICQKS